MDEQLATTRALAPQPTLARPSKPTSSSDKGASPRPGHDDATDPLLLEFDPPSALAAQADRRNARRKLAAGWRGLKAAVRGDSSFFAHGYRGTLIAIAAALLGVNQWNWCLLLVGACLVLIAELAHSAVDTLARAVGDPEEPRLKTAREIAAAGVLVAALGAGAVTLIVLSWKFFELLGWRL
jgi:diacylglycerol kinase (ATP)